MSNFYDLGNKEVVNTPKVFNKDPKFEYLPIQTPSLTSRQFSFPNLNGSENSDAVKIKKSEANISSLNTEIPKQENITFVNEDPISFLDETASNNSDDVFENEPRRSKPKGCGKTRGRVKIEMAYIQNKLKRYTTFSKRKAGILKKAHELSTLTGTEALLLIASETGHVYSYTTEKFRPIVSSEDGKALIQMCLNSDKLPVTTTTHVPSQCPESITAKSRSIPNMLPPSALSHSQSEKSAAQALTSLINHVPLNSEKAGPSTTAAPSPFSGTLHCLLSHIDKANNPVKSTTITTTATTAATSATSITTTAPPKDATSIGGNQQLSIMLDNRQYIVQNIDCGTKNSPGLVLNVVHAPESSQDW